EKRVFLVILFTSFSGSLVSRISGAVQMDGAVIAVFKNGYSSHYFPLTGRPVWLCSVYAYALNVKMSGIWICQACVISFFSIEEPKKV
ncbi:hypothetical protein OSK18_24815, partial [Escherichia coli]|nr:hypothetical protein [Escherichia coli]